MNRILELFKSAIQYADYDFYKLKGEVVSLVKIGRERGFYNPDYCSLTIKNSSKGIDYPIEIDLYYKTNEREAMHLPKSFIIGSFKTIPARIKQLLTQNGFIEIRIDNLLELSLSVQESVSNPIKFDSITSFTPQSGYTNRTIVIKDDLFNYKVTYSYSTVENKSFSKTINYADIIGMPFNVVERLKESGECTLKLE